MRNFRQHVRQRWGALVIWTALGALGGLGYAAAQPRLYEATLSVHFPTTDSETFRKVLQAVSSDSATNETLNLVAPGQEDSKRVDLAREILMSRGAVNKVAQDAGLLLSPEQIERFRENNLRVESRTGSVLELMVSDRRSETARLLCHNLLEYYNQFIKERALTHTGKVRRSLERRYLAMAAQVRTLETKLTGHEDRRRRELGDSLIVGDSETRNLLARQRAEDEKLSADVLKRLRRLRSELKVSQPGEIPGADPWVSSEESPIKDALTSTLGKEKVTADRYKELDTPRPAELLSRARLERNYEDTIALHRILLLQHGILRTLEELEELDYKVIDPLSVHQRPKTSLYVKFGLVGLLSGLSLGLLALALGRYERELGPLEP